MNKGFRRNKPELLAPAGDWECLRAAAAAGADAVYFGVEKFNARMRAENFRTEELPTVMNWLHERGLKGYLTLNILVFQNELQECAELIAACRQSGVDALIIQDLGVARLARKIGVPVHASTQMTVTSPEGAIFARRLGAERVVLARETSLREMERFNTPDMPETEVFVHGALCVSYSGQCLTSEALGERSANRGECAQACRMPYELVVDGVTKNLGDKRYLLSPQDLAALEHIPALIERGVVSFKIEGRLKSPEYVAAVCAIYRKAIDTAWDNRAIELEEEDRYKLEMVFSRGLYDGWMRGVNHQELVHARFGKKRGVYVGKVTEILPTKDAVKLDFTPSHLKAGDGIVFETGGDTNNEQGARIFAVEGKLIRIMSGRINWKKIPIGARVWKTSDPALQNQLREFLTKPAPLLCRSVNVVVKGAEGQALSLTFQCERKQVTVHSRIPLQTARTHPLDESLLREHLGRMGGTPFALGKLDCTALPEGLILPKSELNRMRRLALDELKKNSQSQNIQNEKNILNVQKILNNLKYAFQPQGTSQPTTVQRYELAVLCRKEDQLVASLEESVDDVYLDYEDIRKYSQATQSYKGRGTRLWLATPRIIKAGEAGYLKFIADTQPDGVLIRNLAGLEFYKHTQLRRRGDFSLNMANSITAQILHEAGLENCAASFDLTGEQILDIAEAVPALFLTVVIHQHVPLFHMEHCVFAAFLSNGKDYRDCGRPCEKHRVQLRDRVGQLHTLGADVGCRNTLFHGRAQSAVDWLNRFQSSGLFRFRIDLLHESAEQTRSLIRKYKQFLNGNIAARTKILQTAVPGLGVPARTAGLTL